MDECQTRGRLTPARARPPEETRTPRRDRDAKDHRAPSHISKTVLPTVHSGPRESRESPLKCRVRVRQILNNFVDEYDGILNGVLERHPIGPAMQPV